MTTSPATVDQYGVDLEVLGAWMDDQGFPKGPIDTVVPLGGGTQNIMLRIGRAGQEYILRRPPRHLRPGSNDVLRREIRVVSALEGTEVPAPRIVAACPDDTVLNGAVFYLMDPVDGFSPAGALPPLHASNADIRHAMGLSAVEAIAALGGLDYQAIGLADFGRPDGFLERQVPRWLSELESYSGFEGYPGPDIPGIEETAAWLDRNRPTAWQPGLMHGDCHLSNMMFSMLGPGVAALVDWEMATIGDPLLDLGWLLATWPDGSAIDAISGSLAGSGGLATSGELIAHYERHSGRDLTAIDWYTVLACFKLGIVLEGTHARACAGRAPRSVGDQLHGIAASLFAKAGSLTGP